ncbi:hypothetical protein D3C76_978460 [compost metagenome]
MQLPLQLRPVLLGSCEALGALDGGCIVQRCLGQRLAVLLLADFALAQCQIELGLLFGQRSGGLGGRVVLPIQTSEGVFCLGNASVDVLRGALLRLAGLDVRDFLLDVLAGLGVVGLFLRAKPTVFKGLSLCLVQVLQIVLQLLRLRPCRFRQVGKLLGRFDPALLSRGDLRLSLGGSGGCSAPLGDQLDLIP